MLLRRELVFCEFCLSLNDLCSIFTDSRQAARLYMNYKGHQRCSEDNHNRESNHLERKEHALLSQNKHLIFQCPDKVQAACVMIWHRKRQINQSQILVFSI